MDRQERIDRQIDGQTGKKYKIKQMDIRERYKQKNRLIDGRE